MRMADVLPGAGGKVTVKHLLQSRPSLLSLRSPAQPSGLLTVGKVGPWALRDGDCDGGFLPIACPANILSSILYGGLEDVQAGAADLASHDMDIRGFPRAQHGAPYLPPRLGPLYSLPPTHGPFHTLGVNT